MFTTIFYQPILNLFIFIYNLVPGGDIGWAVLAFTVLIKAVLWPVSGRALKSQKALQSLQPKIDELKKQHAGNKEVMTKEMMALYKQEKINPLSSCLPLLIQLPFLWAIFRVFRDELGGQISGLIYSFIHNPGQLNSLAFSLLDFSKPNIPLAILAGAAQFVQAKMLPMAKPAIKSDGSKDENMAAMMNKQMVYIFPVLTVVICLSLPSGLAFYWFLTTLLTIGQQMLVFKKDKQ